MPGKNREMPDRYEAARQHCATVKLLKLSSVLSTVLRSFPTGVESSYLMKLLDSTEPVPIADMLGNDNVTPGRVSQRINMLNECLRSFSQTVPFLKSRHLTVEVPRRPPGFQHFGYYLACFDTFRDRYLSGAEILQTITASEFSYLLTAVRVLDANALTPAMWFRPGGPAFVDFENSKYHRRTEVDGLRDMVLKSPVSLLVGRRATGKTVIVKTLIYELYKDKSRDVSFFDIARRRNFDEARLLDEIRSAEGIVIVENIHLEPDKVQLIYDMLRNESGVNLLFTSRCPPEEFPDDVLADLSAKSMTLDPFVDAERIVEEYCSDATTPGSVWDRRKDILEVSEGDFWFLAWALEGCAVAQSQGEPQDWIASQVKRRLHTLETCRDRHQDQYPGILVTLSPLYQSEVLTAEEYLNKLGYTRPGLNGLAERGEIVRQEDRNGNTLYGLHHSSLAHAYWKHGRSYVTQKELRIRANLIYDYATSNAPNALQAVMASECYPSILARLTSEGIIHQLIHNEENIDAIWHLCIQEDVPCLSDDNVLLAVVSKIVTGDDWISTGRCLKYLFRKHHITPQVLRECPDWRTVGMRLLQSDNLLVICSFIASIKGFDEDLAGDIFWNTERDYLARRIVTKGDIDTASILLHAITVTNLTVAEQMCGHLPISETAHILDMAQDIAKVVNFILDIAYLDPNRAIDICSMIKDQAKATVCREVIKKFVHL